MSNLKYGCLFRSQVNPCLEKSGTFHGGWSVLFQNVGVENFGRSTGNSDCVGRLQKATSASKKGSLHV
jgi:hypothetical protein